MGSDVELRIRGGRAVLRDSHDGHETDPRGAALGLDLAEALDEWALVATAVLRTGNGMGGQVVSQRGRRLAGRVAAVLGVPVTYRDPLTGHARVVQPTPWATGLTVSVFVAAVVIVAMLALAYTLAAETTGWAALAAGALVTAGMAPSLWLGRRVRIVRWIALGAAAGAGLSWIGVLLIVFG